LGFGFLEIIKRMTELQKVTTHRRSHQYAPLSQRHWEQFSDRSIQRELIADQRHHLRTVIKMIIQQTVLIERISLFTVLGHIYSLVPLC
jgi:hypothetical protein